LDPSLTRHGTKYDRDKLTDVFQQDLKFNVEVYDDCTKDQVLGVIEEAKSSQRLQHIDCFVCAVLTHGDISPVTGKEDLMFHDSKKLALEDLSESLTAENCPCLAGKPKIFIIQACRGAQLDEVKFDAMAFQDAEGSVVQHPFSSSVQYDAIPLCNRDGIIIPSYADFVYAYSTYPGYAAVRGWYIQSLVYCIKKHHKDRSLLQILTMTNGMVSRRVGKSNKTRIAQTAMFTSTLTKPLYLSSNVTSQKQPDSDTSDTLNPTTEVINILKKIPKDERFGAITEIMANLKDLP